MLNVRQAISKANVHVTVTWESVLTESRIRKVERKSRERKFMLTENIHVFSFAN
jgi:hypothetical protein